MQFLESDEEVRHMYVCMCVCSDSDLNHAMHTHVHDMICVATGAYERCLAVR